MASRTTTLDARELHRLVLEHDWAGAEIAAGYLSERIPRENDAGGLYAIGWTFFASAPQRVRDALNTYNNAVRGLREIRPGPEPGDEHKQEEYDPCNANKIP